MISEGAQKGISKLEEMGCTVLVDEPMKLHTTFKTGGAAERLIVVHSREQLKAALQLVEEERLPLFLLGNGSNILVSDDGIDGVVLKLGGEFEDMGVDGERIYCRSGAKLADLCKLARDNSLTGLEFAYGIPGTVGGAVYMNAGAYGGEMKDVVESVEHMERTGEVCGLCRDELELSYRHSVYSGTDKIILGAVIKLERGEKDEITAKMNELMQKRIDKQPYNMPSAGSTFKRPEGYFAAALIEECGLKGERIGTAEVSEKHAGFIINCADKENESGKSEDILKLVERVKEKVFTEKNVRLQCEIKLVGRGFDDEQENK